MPGKPKRSAGILAFRLVEGALEVLLIHPGGPFWAKKDAGTWSIPKGLYAEDEGALVAAKREFEEETSLKPVGDFIELGAFRQPSGKTISAWAIENDFDMRLGATRSRWNGRRGQAACRNFRKQIELNGLVWPKPGAKSRKAKFRLSMLLSDD